MATTGKPWFKGQRKNSLNRESYLLKPKGKIVQRLKKNPLNRDLPVQQIARYNIEKHYSVIGLKQNIQHSFVLLEHFLPRFFTGYF